MGQLHKHAEVIKAWADGADIQVQINKNSEWQDVLAPTWYKEYNYRIKPKTIKYRNFVWLTGSGKPVVSCTSYEDNNREPRCEWSGFVKWINNWEEVEV